ncbi:ATPases of the AAA+ class [Candidatus Rhodobacter oscarellae]|uniref:ATPases of the AAA+ class n=1 Tax=Candidatus Rhodobacter oscarellae TaxID=1675527 RepID=A0A0J9E8K1_9RHOB|nr:DUF4399 domain-containing protein [Candidatus Rhodobacter lobularis]KMW59087.1 ATPases of the AAA+ class [Candidatus Rhodobacter lobularis]
MKSLAILAAAAALTATTAFAGDTPSPEGAAVYFINLEDGATVSSPLLVQFGLKGMGIAPAGTEIENTGHHHLLLDRAALGATEEGAEELEYAIEADENNRHFGKGQTETTLELSPGTHTLQLVLGDAYHVPHNPPVASQVITITVQ